MKIFIALLCLILTQSIVAQLDAKYLGVYLSDEGNAEIMISTSDEGMEVCFIADLTVYAPVNDNFESAHEDIIYSGYGTCDGPNGHMLMNLERNGQIRNLEVSFSMKDDEPILTVYAGDKKTNYSLILSIEDVQMEADGSNEDAIYILPNMEIEDNEYPLFKRSDGALLYVMTDEDGIMFIISAGTPGYDTITDEDPCFLNVLNGNMNPRNEQMTLFSFFNEETGCSLQFKFFNDNQGQRFEVTESNCSEDHVTGCLSWSGTYAIPKGD